MPKRLAVGLWRTAAASLAMVLSATALVCAAEQTGSLLDNLVQVEKASKVDPDAAAALPDRLSVVEKKVFGQTQTGSLVARIEALRKHLKLVQDVPAARVPAHPPENVTGDVFPIMNAVPPNFLRIEPPGATVDPQGDYISEVMKASKGKVLRFKNMPVPVYITPYTDKNFTTAVVKGFEAWEDRTAGSVKFVQVTDKEKARINVIWKRLGKGEDDKGCMLGAHTITKWTHRGNGQVSFVGVGMVPVPVYIPRLGPKYSVPPQVIEVNLDLILSKPAHIRYKVLQNVVTHELGHALGLLGHSQQVNDMMNPITDEHSRLSVRDINTLRKLYEQKVDIPL